MGKRVQKGVIELDGFYFFFLISGLFTFCPDPGLEHRIDQGNDKVKQKHKYVFCIVNVKSVQRRNEKKVPQKALMVAATMTGQTDKVMASNETTVSKIKATTL